MMRTLLTILSGRLVTSLRRFHRDERGDALEYLLVLAVFGIPLIAFSAVLKEILTDYFSMIAFYVGWPFL